MTVKQIRLPASKRKHSPDNKKNKKNRLSATGKERKSLVLNVKSDTRLSASMKRRSLASQQKESLACAAIKKRHSPASKCACASVYARESSSERERECVPKRGRACKRQHKSARQPERVNKRLSKRLACGQAKNNTRLTPRKKTQSLASNKQEETINRSARKKRHSSASKYKETISSQPAKRGSLAQQAKRDTHLPALCTCSAVR